MLDLIVIFVIIIIVVMSKLRADRTADLDNHDDLSVALKSITWAPPTPIIPEQPAAAERPPADLVPPIELPLATEPPPERKARKAVSFSPRIEVMTFNKNNGEIVDRYSRGI